MRIVAPRDFFTCDGGRVEIAPGDRNRRPQDHRLPLPGTLLRRKWKDRTILVEVLSALERRLRRLEKRFAEVERSNSISILVQFVNPEKGVLRTLLIESGKRKQRKKVSGRAT